MPGIIDIIAPAFFTIFIGFALGKWLKLNLSPVVDLALYISTPALVFISLLQKDIVLANAARIWSAGLITSAGCIIAALIVFRLLRQKHSGLYVAIALMNTVNIPFPIIYMAYGAEGLVPATLYFIPNILLMYTFGVYMMSGKNRKDNCKEVLRQPVVYCTLLGLLFNLLEVQVPAIVVNSIDFIGMMALPLVLIILGYNLSSVKVASLPTTLLASFLRMGVGFGLGFLMASVLNLAGIDRFVVIFVSAMPAAANVSILAAKYNNEAEAVSSVVFLTTLASIGIIPVLLYYFS